ncbi:ABC-type transport auxiliary lipoprotein family protein [Pararhodobacter sp. SW119]|uniref:ABC-type transport auxiliary lipoprotein family protein n=1 Tax=Pararhodobacter sp. SW119 TaxID=2780075 RepID=UPI001AE0AA24|nr:ABC-type transport auxiliary lipoprotein family protein [Pararhodobacter sp. SW119]
MILARALLAALAFGLLSGCGGLLGGASTPLEAYDLRAPQVPSVARTTGRSLVIETPGAGGALATDRIMIRPNPLQAQYLPGVRWTEEAPVMLQTVMLRAFEDTNALRYVGRRPLGGFGDVVLVSELTDLQAEIGPDGAVTTRLRMSARFVRESDATVLSSRSFQAVVPVASNETMDVVRGLNAASDAVIGELVLWLLGQIGVRPTS